MIISRPIKTVLALILLAIPCASLAGEYRVSPIKLFFDETTKTGVITLINDGDDPLQLQVKAFEWSQDEEGKDKYHPTDDIIFFPKMMKLEKDEKRILRAGIKQLPQDREKTYRLFIEELPGPKKESEGSRVEISIRFGVPIFVKPPKAEAKGAIKSVSLSQGKLVVQVANTGTAHFRIDSIAVTGSGPNGAETVSQELQGWYLLADRSRTYEMPVTQELCRDTSKFHVVVKTEKFTLQDDLNVLKTLCLP